MAVDALVSQFTKILASMAKEEVRMLLGAEDALRHLEEEVRAFSGVLRDAERRGFTDTSIRQWLADVKDLVYDADDIIDYSRTKLASLSSEHPVILFFSKIPLSHWMGNSIRSINVRLERIKNRESGLKLIAATAPRDDHDHRGSSSRSRIQRQTGPLLDPNILGSGIENDTSNLVGLLTKKEEELGGPRRRITIVAITGMGGVGKTTLAQKIYNHKNIKDSFREPPPMWVCVSQQYTNEKLLKEIIRNAGGDPERYESFAELQRLLASIIEGKKFFLILDDVWAAKVWVESLQNPLQSCAVGSRVLITTRQQSVARQMGAIQLHPVHPLSEEESWSLLCKLVGFQEGGGIGDGGEVGEIGRQIAEKCGGLPLAIKTIAGVLMTKSRTRREWEKILTNPAWSLEELPDGVMGVLYLSYQDLPFQLKQCFIFCSLFPEDYVFKRKFLTQLWIAEGFIAEKGGGDVLLEDVADDYYNELLSRSLLQPIDPEDEDEDEDEECKMHDLLRSLAQFLAGDKYFVGDMSQLVNATNTSSSSSSSLMKLRHLFIHETMDHVVVTQVVKKHESLRTLFINNCGPEHTDDTVDFLFSKLGCLRVLRYFGYPGVKSLPKSVGNLIHLRYLSLSGFPSLLEELPETVGNLSNLQYLILNGCYNLKKLSGGIAKLYKLRVLDLEGFPGVDGLPAGIGRLQHLNCLKGFVTNEEDGWCSLKELSSLSQLRTLTISNLERASIRFRGQPSSNRGFILKHLSHLRHLELRCSFNYQPDGGDDEKQNIQLIFEVEVFPPPSLETFKIYGYFGLKLPSWPLFPNLKTLQLSDCKYLKQLPALPHLEVLKIENCPDLRSIPGGLGYVNTLTTLYISFSDSLSVIENLHSLKLLQVWSNKNLTRVSNLPALQQMEVMGCDALRKVEGLYSLQSLVITLGNEEMESLPGWLLLKQGQPAFPMLKSLFMIVKDLHVLHRCLVDGPDWPKIQHYPQVDITQGYGRDGGPFFVRYTKVPFTFTTNLEADGSAGVHRGGGCYLSCFLVVVCIYMFWWSRLL